jgi:hypothetical protein
MALEIDIKSDSLRLDVPGLYMLFLNFPPISMTTDPDAARATWSAKTKTLTITAITISAADPK